MKAIVAVDSGWGIGYRGSLLARIPEDMRRFRRLTLGKVVVMGRQTFESLGRPLPDRTNIVLSRRLESAAAMVCRSLAELWNELRKYPTDDAFVIGGEAVYAQLLPFCNHLFVTEIAKKYTADKFFVNINEEKGWYLTAQSDYKTHNDIPYRFLEYVKHG